MKANAHSIGLLAAVALFIASASVLMLLASSVVLPSPLAGIVSAFVQPGVAAWWFAFPSLFQATPGSLAGIAFAAAANALLWLLLAGVLGALLRRVRRHRRGAAQARR